MSADGGVRGSGILDRVARNSFARRLRRTGQRREYRAVMAISKMGLARFWGGPAALAAILQRSRMPSCWTWRECRLQAHHSFSLPSWGIFSAKDRGVSSPGRAHVCREEESKGTITKEVHKSLKQLHLNFIAMSKPDIITAGRCHCLRRIYGQCSSKTSEGLIEAS